MRVDIHQYRILILDFGSQYTQLIARRIREIGVYCELWPWHCDPAAIADFSPHGVILSGGPASCATADAPCIPDCLFTLNIPLLGICYGMQAMAQQQGGQVQSASHREFGHAQVTYNKDSTLFAGFGDDINTSGQGILDVWMSHGDKIDQLPPDFRVTAHTAFCPIVAIEHVEKPWFGVQFHPEVTHTCQGKQILERFVLDICQCQAQWKTNLIVEDILAQIRTQVGTDEVILGLSGGVDSAVAAMLLHRAIGLQLTCVFVDNGLLRLNEAEQVMDLFGKNFGLNLVHIDAGEQFLTALQGVRDPEAKRKVIGKVFVDIFEQQARALPKVKWLAQGTIYPDVIESAGNQNQAAHVIKSHHNVGGLPETLSLGLVEPLRALFKDEVRQIGLVLGLGSNILHRHPFPGPGLGVRVLGEVKSTYCDILRRADAIFIQALRQADLYDKVSQAFAVFLPVRSVGVMGDGRCYDWVIALRAVETVDFMTARWAHLPYDFLGDVSRRIINEIPGVSRVVYDISGKPPATIEWE